MKCRCGAKVVGDTRRGAKYCERCRKLIANGNYTDFNEIMIAKEKQALMVRFWPVPRS